MKSFRLYPILFFLIFSTVLQGNQKLDSLQQVLEQDISAETRLNTLIELGKASGRNREVRQSYYQQAIELANKIGARKDQITVLIYLGQSYHGQQNYSAAKKEYLEALEVAQNYQAKDQLPSIYNNLGNILIRQAKIDSSILMFQKSLKGFEMQEEHYRKWKALYGIARAYFELPDFKQTEDYALRAYAIVKDSGNRIDRGSVLYFLALLYKKTEAFEKYYNILEEWEVFQEEKKRDNHYLTDIGHLSLTAMFAQQDESLIEGFAKAVEYFKEKNNPFRLGWSYFDLGQAHLLQKQYPQAKENFLLALKYFKIADYKDRIAVTLEKLYQTEKQLDHPIAAFDYLEQFRVMQDSLDLERMKGHIAELEVKFETEKKEQLLALQKLEINQKTTQRNIFVGSSILLALLALSIFLGLRNRMRLNQKIARQDANLQEQKIKQLEQEKHLLAFNSMLEGQEKERLRIAKDLHDSLGGLLTTVKAHFNALKPKDLKPQSDEIYSKTNKLIDDANVEVRRISHNMVPKALAVSGLKGALEDLIENLEAQGIQSTLELVNLEEEIDNSKSLVLYRALQEISNNIIKHAKAKNVLLQLIMREDQLNVFIEDDGRGFVVKEAIEKGGMGLQNIQSRIHFLKGNIDWDSVPGEGTTVSINIPLEQTQTKIYLQHKCQPLLYHKIPTRLIIAVFWFTT